jgi:hypothetical protein
MADKRILEQMLEHLVNDEKEKADELFHEYVVAKSREIYETLIEDEMVEEEDKDEDEDEDMEEAVSDEDAEEDKVDEEFEDIAIEGDDEEEMGGDPTDDLAGEMDGEMGDEEGEDDMGEKEPEELFQDLDAIVDELQAKFDAMKGGEEGEEEMKDDFELETVREYVEKVPAGHGAEKKGAAEKADNTKSVVDNMKNDMGGTTANILKGGEEKGGDNAGLGQLKPQDQSGGNINVPGGKAGGAFSTKEPGHGAEKKGSAESADNKQSLFRGRR